MRQACNRFLLRPVAWLGLQCMLLLLGAMSLAWNALALLLYPVLGRQRGRRDRVAREVVFEKPQLGIQMPYPDGLSFNPFEGIQKAESWAVGSQWFLHFSRRE